MSANELVGPAEDTLTHIRAIYGVLGDIAMQCRGNADVHADIAHALALVRNAEAEAEDLVRAIDDVRLVEREAVRQ